MKLVGTHTSVLPHLFSMQKTELVSQERGLMIEQQSPSKEEVRLEAESELIAQVWAAMRARLVEIGLADILPESPLQFASTEIRVDPYDKGESLHAEWRSESQLIGSFISHANGSAFAEIDVVKPHPQKEQWFVEATTAWGMPGKITSELRLLPMP